MTSDILASVDILDEFERSNVGLDKYDLWPVLAEYRQREPVHRGDLLTEAFQQPFSIATMVAGRPAYDVLKYDDCMRVLRDTESFSNAIYRETLEPTQGYNILQMDAPEHRLHRAVLQSAFSRQTIDRWRSELMEPLVNTDYIDRFGPSGRADLMRDLALTYPVGVIHRILGLPPERLMELHTLAVGLLLFQTNTEVALAASERLGELLTEYVEERRRDRGDDIISTLLHAEVEGVRLTEVEVVSFLRLLMPAGGETTTRNLASLFLALLSDREQLDLVLDRPELLPRAVEESLRWEPPTTVQFRLCIRDTEIRGVTIPAGAAVNVWTASGSHDEDEWDEPERFDLRREPRPHLSFAPGPHVCLGMHMARAETVTAAAAVLTRLPNLRLDPEAETPRVHGVGFRSPATVPVVFDPV